MEIRKIQGIHGGVVGVDGRVDHTSLLLLQEHHPTLDRVLNAQPHDGARAVLVDAVAPVGTLPLRGRVPPTRLGISKWPADKGAM